MGLDLTLCPERHRNSLGGWFLAYNRIGLDRDYDLYSQIADVGRRADITAVVRVHPLPPGTRFDWYDDEGCEMVTEDPYGSPLTYTTAAELMRADPSNSSPWNRAVWAMLKELPPDHAIVLWWH